MTRIPSAMLLLVVTASSAWIAALDLRNAELKAALAVKYAHAHVVQYEDPECNNMREQAIHHEFVATLQAAVKLYENHQQRDD